MIDKKQQPAELLLGKVLEGGWRVVKKIERDPHHTGGVYSSCYEVVNEERKGFLKAFDYSSASKASNDFTTLIGNVINAFSYERHILEKCKVNRCGNVIRILSHGNTEIPEVGLYPRVEYLILEFADNGDIRDALKEKRATLLFKLSSLHQLTKGLSQIHNLFIAHQDIKPSNVVTLKSGTTKVTDFGSAFDIKNSSLKIPFHLESEYAGSWEYAPPELLYGEIDENNIVRRIGCDLYLLGSMAVFYFTNMSMTALIRLNLDDRLCWTKPSNVGRYKEIEPYLKMAFEKALQQIEEAIEPVSIRDQLVLIIRYLCNPDPNLRGHPKNIEQIGPNYYLNRFVTIFDRLVNKVKFHKAV